MPIPALVAGSCNAGGFGFLAGATIPAEEMERDILRVKELTDKPFGVNFHMYQPNAAAIVDMVIRHGVKAVSYSRSPGPEFIGKLKDAGVVCMPTVGLPKHAIKAVELGADVVTVQGGEGGGHTGAIPTTLLIPQVVDAVGDKVPVVAAGGFKDGRGLLAALAWGADGIAMGTRFLMTEESPVPRDTLQRYIDCKNPGDIIVSRAMDGLPQRMIMNELLADLEKAGTLQQAADRHAQWTGLSQAYRRDVFLPAEVGHRHEQGRRHDRGPGHYVRQCPDDYPESDGRGRARPGRAAQRPGGGGYR